MSNTTSLSNGGYPGGTKIYRAMLNQSGSDAPVATELTNTIGATPTWSRHSAGRFQVTLQGVFKAPKVFKMYVEPWTTIGGGFDAFFRRVSDDTLEILTSGDGSLNNNGVEIIIFP